MATGTDTKKIKYIKNVVFSIVSKLIIFLLGIIIPRLILLNYGSSTNGLLSSVGDIFAYIALIEAGVGNASTQALYKPLAENNREQVSSVIVATQNYFRRLIKWYALAVLIFSCVYPLVVSTDFSFPIVFGVIFIQGASNILTYFFVSALSQLLVADGKEYVSQLIGLLVFILNSVLKIILLSLQANLILIQCGYLVVNIIQIVIIRFYIRKKYPWLNWSAMPANESLAKRRRYMINGVAWTIFSSTDTILLAAVCGLMVSSVYSVYNLVFSSLNGVILILYSSTYFILGQAFHDSKEKFLELYDGIETFVSAIMFALLSVAYVLILPFVSLYTDSVNDIQYVDKYLPLLFCLVQILSNSRLYSGHIVNISNQPQLTNLDSVIEVIINIVLSLGLVFWIGIYGVLIGTIAALFYKTNRIIMVSNKKVLERSPWKTYKIYLVNFSLFFGVVLLNYFFKPRISSYGEFILYGVILTIGSCLVYLFVNVAMNPSVLKLLKFIKRNNKD